MDIGKNFKDWHYVRDNEPLINEEPVTMAALGLGLGAAGKWAWDKWKGSRPQAQYDKNAQANDPRRLPTGDPSKDKWAMPHSIGDLASDPDWKYLIKAYAMNLGIVDPKLQMMVYRHLATVAASAIWGRKISTVDAPDLQNIWTAMLRNKQNRKFQQDPRVIITSVPDPRDLNTQIRSKVPITQDAMQWVHDTLSKKQTSNAAPSTSSGPGPGPGPGPGGPGGGGMSKKQKLRAIKNFYIDGMSRVKQVVSDAKVLAADPSIATTFKVGGPVAPTTMFPDWNVGVIPDLVVYWNNVGKLIKAVKNLPTAKGVFSKADKQSVIDDLEEARGYLKQAMSNANP
jgi:hypothetical protein